MHFGQEEHKRPENPCRRRQKSFGAVKLYTAGHDGIKGEAAKCQGQYHGENVEIFPVGLAVAANQSPKAVYIFIHILVGAALIQINRYGLGKASAVKIAHNAGGQENSEGHKEVENAEFLFVEIKDDNKGNQKGRLKLKAEGKSEKDKGEGIFFLIKIIKGQKQEEAIDRIALSPKAGIEHHGGKHENNGVDKVEFHAKSLAAVNIGYKFRRRKGQKIVENYRKSLVKINTVDL